MKKNPRNERTVLSLSLNGNGRDAVAVLLDKYKEQRGFDSVICDLPDSTIVKAILEHLAAGVVSGEYDFRL